MSVPNLVPNSGRVRPMLARVRPIVPDFVQIWPISDRFGPDSTESGRNLPKLGRLLPISFMAECCQIRSIPVTKWPTSAKFGPDSAKFGLGTTKFGQLPANFAHIGPNSAHIGPTPAKFGRHRAMFGPDRANIGGSCPEMSQLPSSAWDPWGGLWLTTFVSATSRIAPHRLRVALVRTVLDPPKLAAICSTGSQHLTREWAIAAAFLAQGSVAQVASRPQ